jgi:multicomponent Na+:H+ antiporter subunit E
VKAALPIFLTLAALWLTWSGIYDDPIILGSGVLSCLLVTWICIQMDRVDGANPGYGLGLRILTYIPWLALEILKSNLHVAKVVLSPSLPIRPRLVRAKATQQTDLGRVIYANSITLTPGTITLDVRGNDFLVHALTEVTAAGVEEGGMDRKVSWLEGQP